MNKLFYVYVIENYLSHSWYIGFSTDVARRLDEHNQKIGSQFTRKAEGKWVVVYLEGYFDKSDALGREKYLKSGSGRRYIKNQLKNYLKKNVMLG